MNVSEEEQARNRAEHAAVAERVKAAREAVAAGTVTGRWVVLLPLLVIGGFFAVVWLAVNFWPGRSTPAPVTLSQVSTSDIQTACEAMVGNRLKAPAGARFVRSSTPNFIDGQWLYTDGVDAQNALGAMLRNNFVCVVSGTSMADAKVRADLTP